MASMSIGDAREGRMATETNRHLAEAFVADYRAAVLAEDVVLRDEAQGRTFTGQAEVEALLRAFYVEGFPGAQSHVRCIVADEAAAVLEFTFRGRQDGPFMGISPTGREVALPMTIVFRMAHGQIRSARLYYDAGTLLRQLGLALDVGIGD